MCQAAKASKLAHAERMGSLHALCVLARLRAPRSKAVLAAAVAACALGLLVYAPPAVAAEGAGGALASALSFVLHLDKSLAGIIAQYGAATYALLFGIVFCETGLVVTPFLPGDSLLFACGAFAALGSLNLGAVLGLLFVAAVLGDALNYTIGKTAGGWMLDKGVVKQSMLKKTEEFYAKYGGKTIVLARFVPIVRTFAPFVAGMSSMEYSRFAAFNVGGAALWIGLFTLTGYLFGNLPVVQHNFTLVVLAIVVLSVVPVVLEILAARKEAKTQAT